MHAITVPECSMHRYWPLHAVFWGQQVGEACTRYRGVHNAVKSGFLELYFLFCFSWTNKWKTAYSFLSLGSYLNMYHGYASLEKEHFWPVFTEKRAPFQHTLYFEGREKQYSQVQKD